MISLEVKKIKKYISNNYKYELNIFFKENENKNTIKIEKSWYEIAYRNNNYDIIKCLYEYDTRSKDIIINDLVSMVQDSNDLKKKSIFTEKVINNELGRELYDELIPKLHFVEDTENILIQLLKNNNSLEFKSFIKNNDYLLSYFAPNRINNEKVKDLLIFAIENNTCVTIINFICKKYPKLNYTTNGIRSPLSTALAQNNFRIADLLIKNGASLDYCIGNNNIYEYLYNYSLLNDKNLKYLFQKGFYIEEKIIDNHIIKSFRASNYKKLKIIFNNYCFNPTFILSFLYIYQKRIAVSNDDLNQKLNHEANKIQFNISYYKNALEKQNYQLIESLFNHDTRKKEIILNDLFVVIDEDERENHSGSKKVFVSKVKNKELNINLDIEFLDNLQNIEEKRETVTEMIHNNQHYQFKNYIKENKFSIFYFNCNTNDLLLLALDNNVSTEFIQYILSRNYYKSLNYSSKDRGRTPLMVALSKNNFKNADLLLRFGASFDDNFIYNMGCQKLLNSKNLTYILNHGYYVTYNDFKKYLGVLNSTQLEIILKYKFYDVKQILKLLLYSKNRISLSNHQFTKIIGSYTKKERFHDFMFTKTTQYNYNTNVLKLLLKFDERPMDWFLRSENFKKHLFSCAVKNGDYELTEQFFNCRNCNFIDLNVVTPSHQQLNNKKFIKYLKFFITKLFNHYSIDFINLHSYDIIHQFKFIENIKLVKFLFNKIYSHPTFNFKYIALDQLLAFIQDFQSNNKKLHLLKFIIKKAYRNKTFDFQYVRFVECLHVIKKIVIGYKKDKIFDILKYYIDKTLTNKKMKLEYINFNDFIDELNGFDIDIKKYLLEKVFEHRTFNFIWFNIKKFLLKMITSTKNVDFYEYFFEMTYHHPLFNFMTITFEDILYFLVVNLNDINLIKKIISETFKNETFNFRSIDFCQYIYLMNQTRNIKLMKFAIDILFEQKLFNINEIELDVLLFEIRYANNNKLIKYVIDKSINQIEFNFKKFKFIEFLVKLVLVKDYDIIDYFLNTLFSKPNFNFNDIDFGKLYQLKHGRIYILEIILEIFISVTSKCCNNVGWKTVDWNRILLLTNKCKNNEYLTKYIMDVLLSIEGFNIRTINLENLIMEAIDHNNIFISKYLIQLVFDYDLYKDNFVNIETLLLHVNKINKKELIQFILEQLLNISLNQEIIYITNPYLSHCNNRTLLLLLNSFIRIGKFSLIKCFMESNEDFALDINSVDGNGDYPLIVSYYATKYLSNGLEIFHYLLNTKNVNLNIKSNQGISLFTHSLHENAFIVTKYLLSRIKSGSITTAATPEQHIHDITTISDISNLPSYLMNYLLNDSEDFNFSLAKKITNKIDKNGYSILCYAIIKEDIKMVKYLINKGININQITDAKDANYGDHCFGNVFDIAIELGNKTIILILLDSKYLQVNQKDSHGETLLIKIIKAKALTNKEKWFILRKLLKKGVDANVMDKTGKLALTYAIELKSVPLIHLLLSHGANLKELNKNGNNYNESPLQYLVRMRDVNLFKYFIKYYIDEDDAKIIARLIIYRNELNLLMILRDKYSFIINYRDSKNNHLLKYSIVSRNVGITQYLINNNAITYRIGSKWMNANITNDFCYRYYYDTEIYQLINNII